MKYNFKNFKIGDFYTEKCLKKDAPKVANRLMTAAQMYKMRNKLDSSYRVTKVVGAVILERVK